MVKKRTKIIGLTGPIGAGKNEVAKLLKRRGAFIIDADRLAHTLYSTQSAIWRELVRVFGSRILNRGGTINRKKLGEMVFADKNQLKKLNRIIHPLLREAIVLIAAEKRAEGAKLIVINAAVLKEIGLIDQVDEVWLVTADREKRSRRLLKSGLSKKQAETRLNAQMSQREYLKLADIVIRNDNSLKRLAEQVKRNLE